MARWELPFLSLVALVLAAAAMASACATAEHRSPGTVTTDASGDPTGDALGGRDNDGTLGDSGVVDDGSSGPDAPPGIGVGIFSAACTATGPSVPWSPIRRISRVEYDNMVRDLLGDTSQPAVTFTFPPESPMREGINLDNNTYTNPSGLIAQYYMNAAEAVAWTAVQSSAFMSANLPCDAATSTQTDAEADTCAQQFIGTFANRAFRGKLTDDDTSATAQAGLFALYAKAKAAYDFTTGIQAVITAVLESPRFLYVYELGTGAPSGSVIALSQYEIAARLAFLLWRSVPDAALMSAAANGQLSDPGKVGAQAALMLMDPKAQGAINDFTTQWVQLQIPPGGKDAVFAAWNNDTAIRQEMVDETLTNVSQLVLVANGALTDLLSSPASYINSDLATFYGVPFPSGAGVTVTDPALPASTSTNFAKVTIPHRAGILTNGAILAIQAHNLLPSSVLRGKLVREDLLCDVLGMPPPTAGPAPATVGDAGTTRGAFAEHENTQSYCFQCHEYMDPIGFGFGNFDATGAYQTNDANGATCPDGGTACFPAIDSSGQIAAGDTLEGDTGEYSATYTSGADMLTDLSQAPQVRQCFALQEFRYALSRIEQQDDACSVEQIYDAFASSGFNVQKLLVAIVQSDAFLYRSTNDIQGSTCQ